MLKTHVMKMNTENTNCFIYETEEQLIELLGGVRVEGSFFAECPNKKEVLRIVSRGTRGRCVVAQLGC
jgi:hypothetical protein